MTQSVLSDVLPEFAEHLQSKNRSMSTILAYKADIEQLITYMSERGKPNPDDVAADDINAFRDTLLRRKYTAKSVSRKLNAVKTFYKWMVVMKHAKVNAAEDVEHPKIQSDKPKFMSQLEYRALRDAVRDDERFSGIVELILQAGLRISEVSNLKIEDITGDVLMVQAHSTQPARRVPLNVPAKQALDRYLLVRPVTDSPYMFVSKNGKPLAVRNIRAAVDRYMQKAEIQNYSVNDLRTTFMVENIRNGVDIVYLSQVSGHRRISTTERYLELAELTVPGKKMDLIEL
jgi:site-specific recombinase XerD